MLKKQFFTLSLFLVFFGGFTAQAKEYTMSYLFGGTTQTYTDYVDRTHGELDMVSPSYFDLDADGNLVLNAPSKEFVADMHSRGIRVVPFLSNHWDKPSGNKALDNAAALSAQIAQAITQYNFDGVNVDIENVDQLYRDKYTNFVKLLKQKLPGKEVSVAVAANPNNWQTGWHGSYDYEKLSEFADYLLIMAYDESFLNSDPGPVASGSFAEKSIQYALQHAPADKIVLGVPFYGRFWQEEDMAGGYGITDMDIDYLIKNYVSTHEHITESQSAKANVVILPEDEKPKLWGGRVLTAGTYQIWYDDLKSTIYKLELVEKYNIKGWGSWALGQETPEIWEYLRDKDLLANNHDQHNKPAENSNDDKTITPTFLDTSGHWAASAIERVKQNGIMSGTGGGNFSPEQKMTRAEAVTCFMNYLPELKTPESSHYFKDTENHWAKNQITSARNYNIVGGISEDEFAPDRYITREEIALLADKVFQLATTIDNHHNAFTDVSHENNPWSYDSIIKLSENGILSGYPDATLAPANPITRAEAASIFDKLSSYKRNDFSAVPLKTNRTNTLNKIIIEPR